MYLFDCIWELFVVVGTKARSSKRDIRLALSAAMVCRLYLLPVRTNYAILQDLSSRNAADRPFKPPIHVLVLPSKLPLDLRLHFRDIDEEHIVCQIDFVFVFHEPNRLALRLSERNIYRSP